MGQTSRGQIAEHIESLARGKNKREMSDLVCVLRTKGGFKVRQKVKVDRGGMEQGVAAVAVDLERRAEKLREELAIIESDLAKAREFSDLVSRTDPSVFAMRSRRGTFEVQLTEAIYRILTEEQPIHRAELLRRVEAADLHVGGLKPLDTFAAYLTRDPRFSSVGKGYWHLVEGSASLNGNYA